jgi:putative tryptophan/tyrosine transport system substrate-binding protein
MRRRDVIAVIGGAAMLWSLVAAAQQRIAPVIGFLGGASAGSHAFFIAGFQQGLEEAGFIDGQSVRIEYRWAEGRFDRLSALAADLAHRQVNLIVAQSDPAALAVKNTTTTIPIVFIAANPVGSGLVPSLSRSGHNITGVSLLTTELMAKRVELLSELVPQAKVIAMLVNPNNPNGERMTRDAQEAARTKGVQLPILNARNDSEIDAAFAALAQLKAGAMVISADTFFNSRREYIVALASLHGVPTIYEWREFALAGGLISYGTSITSVYRKAGVYAGRILKGEKPADLPVEQPTKFELVINSKTASALGLPIPPPLLARADEVIE